MEERDEALENKTSLAARIRELETELATAQATVVKREALQQQLERLQTTSKKKDQQIIELVGNQSRLTVARQLAEREQQAVVSKLQGME